LEKTLNIQSVLKKQVKTMLKNYSIPTEDTIAAIYKSLHETETKNLDLEEKLEELEKEFNLLKQSLKKEKKSSSISEANRKVKTTAGTKKRTEKKQKERKVAKKSPRSKK
ncbi:hypothetical protein ACFL35_17130, partial [Candidatus Riflebacteria bacterium]